jgi:hypothetical protein
VKRVLLWLAASIMFSGIPAVADEASDLNAAHQLIDKYYATTRKAKHIEDILPLMAKKNQDQVKNKPVPPEMQEMAMGMIRTSVPNSYTVVSQKVEPDRVTFNLNSQDFPKDQLFPIPKDSVAKGEFVAVKEDGEWKVYKDYWIAKSPDGNEKTSFGTNPDGKDSDEKPADDKPAEAKPAEEKPAK